MILMKKKKDNSSSCSMYHSATTKCSSCSTIGFTVNSITIKSQLKSSHLDTIDFPLDGFNFCKNHDCDTVYYSDDNKTTFAQVDIKSKVTLKNDDPKTPLCYCKKLLKEQVQGMIRNNHPNIVNTIKSIISEGKSFCEKANPKGACCTEDIKDYLATFGISWDKPTQQFFTTKPHSACC